MLWLWSVVCIFFYFLKIINKLLYWETGLKFFKRLKLVYFAVFFKTDIFWLIFGNIGNPWIVIFLFFILNLVLCSKTDFIFLHLRMFMLFDAIFIIFYVLLYNLYLCLNIFLQFAKAAWVLFCLFSDALNPSLFVFYYHHPQHESVATRRL